MQTNITPTTSSEVIDGYSELGLATAQQQDMMSAFSAGAKSHNRVLFYEVRYKTADFLANYPMPEQLPAEDIEVLMSEDSSPERKDFAAAFLVTRCVSVLLTRTYKEQYHGEFA
jgi:hypothetical protein